MLTLGLGFGVLLTSLLLTYIVSSKADILFSSEREPSNATYWLTTDPGPHWQLRLFQQHLDKQFLSWKQKMVHCIKGRGSGGSLKRRLHLMNSSGEETDWKRLDRPGCIWTHQGQETLVSYQPIRPMKNLSVFVSVFFLLFFLFLFCLLMVSWWALYDWMSEVREIEKTISCVKSRL